MPAIKAILFDKDGTIFDSEQIYCDAWVATAKRFNVTFTAKMYDAFVGVRSDECHKKAQILFGSDFPMAQFIAAKDQYIAELKQDSFPIKKGFVDFFTQAKKLHIPLGLVTSSAKADTLLSFANSDFMQYFSVIVTGDQVVNAKPAPECYLLASQQLGIKPENILVFEDSNAGITAALAAGCQTVAIPDYLPVKPELIAHCKAVLGNFTEAHYLLNDIANN